MNETDVNAYMAFRECITTKKCSECPWEGNCLTLKNRKVSIPIDLALAVQRQMTNLIMYYEDKEGIDR